MSAKSANDLTGEEESTHETMHIPRPTPVLRCRSDIPPTTLDVMGLPRIGFVLDGQPIRVPTIAKIKTLRC